MKKLFNYWYTTRCFEFWMKLSQWVRYRRLLNCFVLKVIDKQICFSHAPCKKVRNPAYPYLWIPESSQFLACNPESKTVLDSITWGDTKSETEDK